MRPFYTSFRSFSATNAFYCGWPSSKSDHHHQCCGILTAELQTSFCCASSSSSGVKTKKSDATAAGKITPRRKIQSHDTFFEDKDGNEKVHSASKWKWNPFCTQFAKLQHSPKLSLRRARTMEPDMQVFSKLDIDEYTLLHPPSGSFPYDHCHIENAMNSLGHRRQHNGLETPRFDSILKNNKRMVDQLAASLQQEHFTDSTQEKKIDECSHQFLELCGFADEPFKITSESKGFQIFRRECKAVADQYVVLSQNRDLVLIFEDKAFRSGKKKNIIKGHDDPHVKEQGHLGQITGELLQCLSLNRVKKVYRNVFAIRYINYHVTGFRIDTDKGTLDTLVDTDFAPKKKLKLLCTVEKPMLDRGWSLLDKKERWKALKMMADIREYILTESPQHQSN